MSSFFTSSFSPASLIASGKTCRVSLGCGSKGGVVELTRRLSAHDEEAFREFHAAYFDRLYQFLLVVARGREHEAQEALQETLLRVARSARAFDDEDTFWCWLKAVARSAARDVGRKQRRYFSLLERFSMNRSPIEVEPDSGVEARLRALLTESLGELSPDERGLVERKYLDGVAIKELSSSTGLTEKAVESRLLRLRRRIRQRILKKLSEP